YPSRMHAESRERGLIRSHCPPFNKVHNPHWQEVQAAYYATHAHERTPAALVRAARSRKKFLLETVAFTASTLHLKTREQDRLIVAAIDPTARRSEIVMETSKRRMVLSAAGFWPD